MSKVIAIGLILGVIYLSNAFYNYWLEVKRQSEQKEAAVKVDPNTLEGLPQMYEKSLEIARQKGVEGLKNWLNTYRSVCTDPKLASIELDYVVLVNKTDPAEARRVFLAVRNRTSTSSPIYPRLRLLARAYE